MLVKMINKMNYEQYAMDYLEGNLKGNELEVMEQFLSEHSDIAKELEEMKLLYLPKESITYPFKNDLLQKEDSKVVGLFVSLRSIAAVLIGLLFLAGLTLYMTKFNDSESNFVIEDDYQLEKEENNKIDVKNELNDDKIELNKAIEIVVEENTLNNKEKITIKSPEKSIKKADVILYDNKATEDVVNNNPSVKINKNNPENINEDKEEMEQKNDEEIIALNTIKNISFENIENHLKIDETIASVDLGVDIVNNDNDNKALRFMGLQTEKQSREDWNIKPEKNSAKMNVAFLSSVLIPESLSKK